MTTLAVGIPTDPFHVVAFAPSEFDTWLRHRKQSGGDRQDEVWNGVYVVMPMGNVQYQELVGNLTFVFKSALGDVGARVFPGCNISDSPNDWTSNYRCSDIAVYLPGNPAVARDAYWLGGPDFAVEVVSKNDRAREKFGFYAKVGVRELLFVDRQPSWSLELFRRDGDEWISAGITTPESPETLHSEVLSLSFRLNEAQPHPQIEVRREGSDLRWLA